VLSRAIALREALYRIFTTMVGGEAPPTSDLLLLNGELAAALAHRCLISSEAGFDLAWSSDGDELSEPLWPVALSAAELLTSGSVARVKSCASHDCAWVFMDESRNRSRQWCEMETCGNRAKARRHYARGRAG
jgi:predicted RNA-binding Zn ribbon-like protein